MTLCIVDRLDRDSVAPRASSASCSDRIASTEQGLDADPPRRSASTPAPDGRRSAHGDMRRVAPPATARTAAPVRFGRSHAATTTPSTSPRATEPTEGIDDAAEWALAWLCVGDELPAGRRREPDAVPADEDHRPAPGGFEDRADVLCQRSAVEVDQRLVATEPLAAATAEHGAADGARGSHRQAGGPAGSSCWRNCSQRSASSVSPIMRRHLLQPAQTAEEPDVRRFGPAHVARAAPTVGAQRVEAAVVADAVGRVALDRVASRRRRGPPRRRRNADRRRRRRRRHRVAPMASRADAPRRDVPRRAGSAAGSTVDGRPPGDIVIGRSSAIRDSGYPAHLI